MLYSRKRIHSFLDSGVFPFRGIFKSINVFLHAFFVLFFCSNGTVELGFKSIAVVLFCLSFLSCDVPGFGHCMPCT